MLVFWKQKLVIYSVPKTGSSAIDTALAPHADIAVSNPPTLKHMPVYRYKRFMQPLFDMVDGQDMETFALIREPFSWLGSWYKFRGRPFVDGTPNSTRDISFDNFVLEAMKGKPAPFANVGSQERFLNSDDAVGVDHLFQYEQMDKAIGFLQDRLGREISLDTENVSPQRSYNLSEKVELRYRRKRHAEFVFWDGARK